LVRHDEEIEPRSTDYEADALTLDHAAVAALLLEKCAPPKWTKQFTIVVTQPDEKFRRVV